MTNETEQHWVPAITLEAQATPEQRARNYALYLRLRDGTPEAERLGTRDGVGLHVFTFEVPAADCAMDNSYSQKAGGMVPHWSFRLDRDSECYRRLLSYISDHFDTKCDADEEVVRLRAEVADLRERLSRTGDRP